MNRNLFFVTLATAALASCSQNETVDINNGQAIGFRTAMGIRAVETTTGDLGQFNVTALDASGADYFNNSSFASS